MSLNETAVLERTAPIMTQNRFSRTSRRCLLTAIVAALVWSGWNTPLAPGPGEVVAPVFPAAHAQVGGCNVMHNSFGFYGQMIQADAVVWLLDRSGSMSGMKLETMKQEVVNAVQALSPGQQFGIVTFASETTSFRTTLVPASVANRVEAVAWVQALQPGGATCLAPAGVVAVQLMNASQSMSRRVILVTDGVPNCPGPADTIAAILSANFQQVPIDVFFIGAETAGSAFGQQLATSTGGQFYQVQ